MRNAGLISIDKRTWHLTEAGRGAIAEEPQEKAQVICFAYYRPCCSSLDTHFSAQRPFFFAWRPAALGVQWGTGVALQCHGPDQRRMS
jgi:hypothetical protein